MTCNFCSLEENEFRIFSQNDYAYAMVIQEPLFEGHSIVISKRYVATIDELNPAEAHAFNQILRKTQQRVDKEFQRDSIIFFHGDIARSQPHLHAQIIPLPIGMGMRKIFTSHFGGEEYPEITLEKLTNIAKKMR